MTLLTNNKEHHNAKWTVILMVQILRSKLYLEFLTKHCYLPCGTVCEKCDVRPLSTEHVFPINFVIFCGHILINISASCGTVCNK